MTLTSSIKPDARAAETTSPIAESGGIDSAGSGRPWLRRTTVAAACLVAVISVIAAVVGMVFPEMLAAAVAFAVLAVLVGLDRVLGSRGQQQNPLGYWTF